MHFIFYKTNDVFEAEELLNNNNINVEVVPTPVQDKAYCGVCLKIPDSELDKSEQILSSMEYQKVS